MLVSRMLLSPAVQLLARPPPPRPRLLCPRRRQTTAPVSSTSATSPVPAVEGTLNVLRAAKEVGGVRQVVICLLVLMLSMVTCYCWCSLFSSDKVKNIEESIQLEP